MAGKDPNHYLRVQIAEMEARAPKLKRFERLQVLLERMTEELGEIKKFYKATCEDLNRLKIKEKYLLNQSIDSFGVVTPGNNDLEEEYLSQDY